jgi:hypothetical protein
VANGYTEVQYELSPDGEQVTLTLPVSYASDMLEAASERYHLRAGRATRSNISLARVYARLAEHLIQVKERIEVQSLVLRKKAQ